MGETEASSSSSRMVWALAGTLVVSGIVFWASARRARSRHPSELESIEQSFDGGKGPQRSLTRVRTARSTARRPALLNDQERESAPDLARAVVDLGELPLAAFTQAVDEQLASEAASIDEDWIPTRETLSYRVLEHRCDQIAHLTAEKVLRIMAAVPEAREFEGYLECFEATDGARLDELLPMPTEADLDRLWSSEGERTRFEDALLCMHYEDVASDAANRGVFQGQRLSDEARARMRSIQSVMETRQLTLWRRIGETDRDYPHWRFLMLLSHLHFGFPY